MPYEITIKKIEKTTRLRKGEHTQIDERPWTDEDLRDASERAYGKSPSDIIQSSPMKKVFGYAPDTYEEMKVEIEILKQTVEDLDIATVIKAINKL